MSIFIPKVIATPAGLALISAALSQSIDIIKSWNIRVAESSRLPLAVRLLDRSATLWLYPDSAEQLLRIGNAINAAFDFYNITRFLPDDPIAAIREDLRRALGGTLGDIGPTSACRAQNQLLVAALLMAGGLKAGSPSTDGRSSPDYFVEIGSVSFAVEIKRPESSNLIRERVDDAIDQIDSMQSSGGLVVVDVTDCIGSQSDPDAIGEDGKSLFNHICDVVRNAVTESKRPGLGKVTNLFVLGIWIRWLQKPIEPKGLFLTCEVVFRKARAGLIMEQSEALNNRILSGIQALGGGVIERKRA